MKVKNIGEGKHACSDILGDVVIDRVRPQDAYGSLLAGSLTSEERLNLLTRLVQRAYIERDDLTPRGKTRLNSESNIEAVKGYTEFKEKVLGSKSSSL